jgi:hypothetical protein
MATRRIEQTEWYFGEEDKAEVKKYSKEISILFKIKGYDPEDDPDLFFDCFDLDEFDFIPCIKEAIHHDYEDTDVDSIMAAFNSAYDSSVEVSLQDLEKYVENKDESVNDILTELLDNKEYLLNNIIEFIDTCGSEIKQKFVNWITN